MAEPSETKAYSEAQERLIRATLETINEGGIANATTRRIAERAEVNLQLIQYYFGGKDSMIEEAEHFVVERFFEVVGPAILEAPTLVEAIRSGTAATWKMARAQPEVVQPDLLLQAVRAGKAGEQQLEGRQVQRRIAALLETVAERTGERLIVPADEFALLVAGGLSGLILEFRVTGDESRTGAAVGHFGELLVSLVAPAED